MKEEDRMFSIKQVIKKNDRVYRFIHSIYAAVMKPAFYIIRKKKINECRLFFQKSTIMPQYFKRHNNKKKVRVLAHTHTTWNVLEPICHAFVKDESYDLLFILNAEYGTALMRNILIENAYPYISSDKYDLNTDCPDVLLISHPRENVLLNGDRKYVKLVIAATSTLTRYAQSLSEFWHWSYIGYERFEPDFYLFDSLMYNEMLGTEYESQKIVEMGNAKFDGIYRALQKGRDELGWPKLRNKKVILWATDHGVYDGAISDDISFDIFAKDIFKYFAEQTDVGLIFRPHSTFVQEMLRYGYWTQDDINDMKQMMAQSENIVWDDRLTYENSYAFCDGILADPYCGILCSALPTLKPMCILYRSKNIKPLHPEISECQYSAYNIEEIYRFIEMIVEGTDYKFDLRKNVSDKLILHFDGQNGERIKKFVDEKLEEC